MNTRGRIIRFTWDEWKWLVLIVMLGINMYWTAFNIAPNQQQLQQAAVTQQQIKDRAIEAGEQNEHIIEVVNNNTEKLQNIIANQSEIMDTQLVLVRHLDEHANNASTRAGLILDINKNISDIRNVLYLTEVKPNQTLIEALIEKEMREFVDEMKENLSRNN